MTTPLTAISKAMQTRLSQVSGAPKIQYENDKPYEPARPTRYWACRIIPNKPIRVTADGMMKHTGRFMVDIKVPTNIGTKQALADADAIITKFNDGTSIEVDNERVDIEDVGDTSHLRTDAWFTVSIEVNYACWAY